MLLGVRLEKRLVKVLKALAEYYDWTLTELLEDMILHELEGGGANALGAEHIKIANELKKVYRMDYGTHGSYRFQEKRA